MKYKKKHQKPLISLSILLLFLFVLNINNTFTFENIESKYTEDTYKENFEDLSPELIIENPKNADYFSSLDFMPYGIYIYAPEYIQRYAGQMGSDIIQFRVYDANGGWFSDFEIYVNDIKNTYDNWYGDTVEFNIYQYIQTSGIYNITAQAFNDRTNEWVTHHSILNVTSTSPSISPFYDDFMHTRYSYNSVDWNIYTSNSRYYNCSIYINDTIVYSRNESYDNYLDFDYINYGDFDTLDLVNEIKFEIIDEMGEVTINKFEIKNVGQYDPYITAFDRNCPDVSHLTLWETEGFKLQVSAYSSENDLGKIVVIVNNLPIHTIDKAENNVIYDVPIDTNSFNKLRDDYGYIDNNLNFRAIAITDYGRSSHWDSGYNQYMELRSYDYNELIEKTEDVTSGRNIETLEIIEETYSNTDLEYSFTVVTDVLTPTTLTIAGSPGRAFEQSIDIWDHCYNENEGNCEIFGGYDEHDDWDRGGIVFWVSVTNQSAVQFPMIVKIVYPEEIHPDGINKIWDLQFMHWVENCETDERGWIIYRNESISENRDETLKKVGDKAIEVLIYSQGLYTFGIVPGNEDNNRGGFFISSFPIGLFLFSLGIAISTISLKSKLKIKKK